MQLLIKTLHDLFTVYIGWTVAIIVVWAVIATVLIRNKKKNKGDVPNGNVSAGN